MTRAVLDVDVIVAAALSPEGAPAHCLRAHAEGRFVLVVSPLLVDELATVIGREKFRPFLSVKDGQQLTWALAHDATVVDDPPDVTPLSRDRRDDYLVALARAADAQVLVTGDADLLELGLLDLSIVTPRAFLELLPE